MDFKNSTADKTTETQNLTELDKPTENIYEAVVIMSKRADQINDEMREELHDKLEEFATSTETLEEIFDNKEQIEVSKFYENLPKPTAIAAEEWKQSKIYYRHTEEQEKDITPEE
jgi:DNA-directed RNA polymerase subunit K/omega